MAAATLIGLGQAALATDSRPTNDQREQISQLVRELGSDSFVTRQKATRELTEMGVVTRDALLAATGDPDAEVRVRARSILAAVSESDFLARLQAFAADLDGSQKQTLPGWDSFTETVGTSRAARQLFVEMQRAEPELLSAFAKGGKSANEMLNIRCREVMSQMANHTGAGPVSLGTIASLLFVASGKEMELEEPLGSQFFPWMANQNLFQKYMRGGGANPEALRSLLGVWFIKDAHPSATAHNLLIAAFFDLRGPALTVAAKTLGLSEPAPPFARYNAILTIGKFGAKEHLPLLEKMLADATSCGTIQVPGPNSARNVELQVRDIALAVLVQLTGQKLRDYGPTLGPTNTQTPFQVASLTFTDAAERDKAHKLWAQWRAEHPLPQ